MSQRKTRRPSKPIKRAKFRLKLEADISGWEAGGWPSDLAKAMKVTTDYDAAAVTFEIDDELWEKAALKIAKEAIEAFFDDGIYVSLSKDGVTLNSAETADGNPVVISPSRIYCELDPRDRDALVGALSVIPYEADEGYDIFSLGQLGEMAGSATELKPVNAPPCHPDGVWAQDLTMGTFGRAVCSVCGKPALPTALEVKGASK